MQNTESSLKFLGGILQFIDKYGVFNIIRAIIVCAIFILTLRICYEPSFLMDTYQNYIEKKHLTDLEIRTEADKKIKEMLPSFLYKCHSDRIWIIQCHNGISDWRYGSMRFEVCSEGVVSIKEQYDDFHLSWLDLYYYLEDHGIFIGSTEDLKTIDPTLYTRLLKNEVKYIACTLLSDVDGKPIGVLGHTWQKDINMNMYYNKIKDNLLEERGAIATYLTPIKYK